jgi:hypothetical protein
LRQAGFSASSDAFAIFELWFFVSSAVLKIPPERKPQNVCDLNNNREIASALKQMRVGLSVKAFRGFTKPLYAARFGNYFVVSDKEKRNQRIL